MTSQGALRDSTFVSFSHPGGLKIGSELGFPQYTHYEVLVRLKSIFHVALTLIAGWEMQSRVILLVEIEGRLQFVQNVTKSVYKWTNRSYDEENIFWASRDSKILGDLTPVQESCGRASIK